MIKKFFSFLLICSLLSTLTANSETFNPIIQLANLEEELSLIKRSLGIIELKLEAIVTKQKKQQALIDNFVKINKVKDSSLSQNLSLNDLKKMTDALKSEALLNRKDILQRIEGLALQTESSLNLLRQSLLNSAPRNSQTYARSFFSNDYPKEGIEYTVQAGDNLTIISEKFNSNISWIKNANQITDPKKLNIGKILFIPQE